MGNMVRETLADEVLQGKRLLTATLASLGLGRRLNSQLRAACAAWPASGSFQRPTRMVVTFVLPHRRFLWNRTFSPCTNGSWATAYVCPPVRAQRAGVNCSSTTAMAPLAPGSPCLIKQPLSPTGRHGYV